MLESLLAKSRFSTQEECIDKILGRTAFGEPNEAMKFGTANEPFVRDNFKKLNNVEIYEPSLCLSLRWQDIPTPYLGEGTYLSQHYGSMLKNEDHPAWMIAASPDGLITYPNGQVKALEIKCPKMMYQALMNNVTNLSDPNHLMSKRRYTEYHSEYLSQVFAREIYEMTKGTKKTGAVDYFGHIFLSHFLQMQHHQFVCNKKECVYVVASLDSSYVETVPFDERYYKYFVYPRMIEIIEQKIKPEMSPKQRDEFSRRVRNIIRALPPGISDTRIPF